MYLHVVYPDLLFSIGCKLPGKMQQTVYIYLDWKVVQQVDELFH